MLNNRAACFFPYHRPMPSVPLSKRLSIGTDVGSRLPHRIPDTWDHAPSTPRPGRSTGRSSPVDQDDLIGGPRLPPDRSIKSVIESASFLIGTTRVMQNPPGVDRTPADY